MGTPVKALSYSSLTHVKRVAEGSHETWNVTFREDGGITEAYYKPLDSKYPKLLAQISVAASLFARLAQGSRAAEERLVFDKGELVGTVSFALADFQPFLCAGKEAPANEAERQKVIPSTETLIAENFIESLFLRWFLGDNDPHPGNMGLKSHIDYDMFFYWFVVFMKGFRTGIKAPSTHVNLSNKNYHQFPCLSGSGGDEPYHCPTFLHPGQESIVEVAPEALQKPILSVTAPKALPKVYADPEQFIRLAGDTRAQEQKLAAALKILLTFDPVVVHARLEELFGDMPLDLSSLGSDLRGTYEREFRSLCNPETDKQTFVSFIMNLFQMHYDNLYRIAVLDMGCENNGHGLTLPATSAALYSKPSLYKKILAWIENENETTYAQADLRCKYNVAAVEQRYHQVFRDSFAPKLKGILSDSYGLINTLLKTATDGVQIEELVSKKTTDDDLTSAWELFGVMKEISIDAKRILIDKPRSSDDLSLSEALGLVIEYTRELYSIIKTYYQKERTQLTQEDNMAFYKALERIDEKYTPHILRKLAHITKDATTFHVLSDGLMSLAKQMRFDRHLLATDERMEHASTSAPRKELPLTDPEVINEFNHSLFRWVDSLTPEEFNKRVYTVITRDYESLMSLVLWRQRAEPVKLHLENSTDSNSKKLAYILGTGTSDSGALNSALIKEFTEPMLQKYYIPSIAAAYRLGTFNNDGSFTKSAVHYAKTDAQFASVFVKVERTLSFQDIAQVYEAMYQWVDDHPTKFTEHLSNALEAYDKQKSRFSSLFGVKNRRTEVEEYVRLHYSPAKIMASVFLKGDASSDLSKRLFNELFVTIKMDSDKKPGLTDGLQLIGQSTIAERELLLQIILTHSVTRRIAVRVEHTVQPTELIATASSSSYGQTAELDSSMFM